MNPIAELQRELIETGFKSGYAKLMAKEDQVLAFNENMTDDVVLEALEAVSLLKVINTLSRAAAAHIGMKI